MNLLCSTNLVILDIFNRESILLVSYDSPLTTSRNDARIVDNVLYDVILEVQESFGFDTYVKRKSLLYTWGCCNSVKLYFYLI